MSIIDLQEVYKFYTYYTKEKGLRGAFKNLFHRETLTKKAVNGVNFSIDKGSIVGLVGLNGAGKTTTLKMMSGILKPTNGTITIMGQDPFKKNKEFLRSITMVMGNKSQLWWDIPAQETFELNKTIYELSDHSYNAVLDEMVESLQVHHLIKTQVRRLSLGERMKMELIAALIHSPQVMFLDEPTIGLDMLSQQNIRKFLKKYNEQHQTTIILTSHNIDDLVHLCDRLLLINNGEIILDKSFDDFMKEYSTEKILTVQVSDDVTEVASLLEKQGVFVLDQKENELKISVGKADTLTVTQTLVNEHFQSISDMTIENMDIEEIIKKIYGVKG